MTLRHQALRWLAAATLLTAGHSVLVESRDLPAGSRSAGPLLSEYTIPDAQKPRDPWPHSAGGIYFSMAGADKIVRFDSGTRQFHEWALPAGAKPHGVAVASDGTIFYAGYGDDTIGELDPRTGTVRRHQLSLNYARPYSVALDSKGNVWVTLRGGGIAMLDRAIGRVTEHKMDGGPYGLAFDRDGMLWVTCIDADKLRRFNPKTSGVTEITFDRGSKPRRLSIAGNGQVWVSLYGVGRLAAVDIATTKIAKVYTLPGGANSGPYSVNVGPGGRVWVTEFQTDSIAVLDPATGAFKVIPLTARAGVRSAAIDALGRFWFISSASGKIGLVE